MSVRPWANSSHARTRPWTEPGQGQGRVARAHDLRTQMQLRSRGSWTCYILETIFCLLELLGTVTRVITEYVETRDDSRALRLRVGAEHWNLSRVLDPRLPRLDLEHLYSKYFRAPSHSPEVLYILTCNVSWPGKSISVNVQSCCTLIATNLNVCLTCAGVACNG